MRSSRNFGPGRTTLQLGASPMPSMNAVARATVEGGLNMRRCVTTRMNSVTSRSLARRAVSSLRESALATTYVPAPFGESNTYEPRKS